MAYRTSSQRNELARHLAMALIAPVRGPALHTFFPGSETSCLEITPKARGFQDTRPVSMRA
jgi:hypothetical protein